MLITYLGRPDLKAAFLAEIAKHEAADAFVKGTYGRTSKGAFRGCAIGCSLHSLNILQGKVGTALVEETDDHARYEAELGLPTWLAYLEDHIFESLPTDLAIAWPRRFAEAIPVGVVVADRVLAQILHWTLVHETYGVTHTTDDAAVKGFIDIIATALAAEASGTATAEQREAAARAARAAWAAWDARDARDAWAARAAWAARDAWAAWDARDAWAARDARDAWAARDARDAWAARDARDVTTSSRASKKADAFSAALSDYVIEILRSLPVTSGGGQ